MATQAPVQAARRRQFKWGAGVTAVLCAAAVLVLWVAPSHETSGAPGGAAAAEALTSRGYTDAPTGTAVIGGNPWAGGAVLKELRVKENQKVRKGEIIAVLSNYPLADISVRTAEAELDKAERARETMTTGYRVSLVEMQEMAIKTLAEQVKLQALELSRTNGPPDVKNLQLEMAKTGLERQKARLQVMKESLASSLAQTNADLKILRANVENARAVREQSLVRSPLDGVVVQVYARPGERVAQTGIAKIVDMSQVRVIADVDEQHMDRARVGAKVEVTFRGSADTYSGRISRVVPVVKRMQRIEPDGGTTTDAPVVQVEVELDNPSTMPQVLGREARVTFL